MILEILKSHLKKHLNNGQKLGGLCYIWDSKRNKVIPSKKPYLHRTGYILNIFYCIFQFFTILSTKNVASSAENIQAIFFCIVYFSMSCFRVEWSPSIENIQLLNTIVFSQDVKG